MARVDPVLLLGAACLFAGAAAVAPVAACAGAVGVLWLLRKRVRVWVLGLAAFSWGVGWWRSAHELAEFELARVSVRAEVGAAARCAISGRVVTSPEWLHGSLRYWVRAERLECDDQVFDTQRVIRLYGGPRTLARGDRIEANVQLGPIQLFRNLDVADPTPLAARKEATLVGGVQSVSVVEKGKGLGAVIDGWRAGARERIFATFSPQAEPLARALVLGENDLTAEDDAAFKKSGLAHLLAVSGTHLVFAVVMLVRALRSLLVRVEALALRVDVARVSAFFGACLALLYADFAGGSGSAFRAAWMLVAAFLARALGRQPRCQRILGVTMCVGAIVDPLVAFDVSFLLSLGATVGLILWSGAGASAARASWRALAPIRFLESGSLATVSALLPCIPILALMSDQVSLLGIVGNLVAGPIGEIVALPVCLLHAVCAFLPALEHGLALVGGGALLAVNGIAHATASQSWLALPLPYPTPWHRVIVVLAGLSWLLPPPSWLRRPRVMLGVTALVCLGVVEVATRVQAVPTNKLRFASLDVGQGDSALVDLPDGRLMLIDGGGFVGSPVDPGASVILPVLRARRRSAIDVMVLSHPHPDHFLGLLSVAQSVPVREFWTTREGEAEHVGPYLELLRVLRQKGTRVRYPPELCRAPESAGGARIVVLAPCPDFDRNRHANDNSLVLRLEFGERRVLTVGDAEVAEEGLLARQYGAQLKADFLKVGHHGSRTSSTAEFLRLVRPQVALVSTGFRNRFGHPHEVALERLRASGAAVFRTDRNGSVVWETDGHAVTLFGFSGS
ncbi:MAG: DNA internalization-related competence protein ComEC/Rec2 [Polyangiaceae bacterium]|nr:DNA internalization-related competence protein ComEC/Rec2 [Polyangiaceae bacterium]